NNALASTWALAIAIPQLSGSAKTAVRDVLAERLAGLPRSKLKRELKNEDPEMRRAAALACAKKKEIPEVPAPVPPLEDPQSSVARAAHAALRALTKHDFGPAPGGGKAEREGAMAHWRDWWSKEGKAAGEK